MRNLGRFGLGFGNCEAVDVFREEAALFTGLLDSSGIVEINLGKKEFEFEEETREGDRVDREGEREIFSAHDV